MKRETSRKRGRRDAAKAATARPDPAALATAPVSPDSAVERVPPAAAPAFSELVDPATPDSVAQPKPAEREVAVGPLLVVPAPASAAIPEIEPSLDAAAESPVEPIVESRVEPAADPVTQPEASPAPVAETAPDATGEAGPPPSEIGRRGQIQAAKARFDLGPQQRILGEALGELPPGHGLTHCSAWVRDPRHVIAVWDINSTEQTERGQELGWERVVLRLLDSRGDVLRQIPVARRSGIWHVLVPNPGMAVRVAVGFAQGDGRFETVARSHYVQLPPGEPGSPSTEEKARLPSQLDRRTLLRAEPPPRPGFGAGGQESPGWRLHQRIRISRRAAQTDSWFGPFRTTWDSGVAPPPRVVIEPEPDPAADDESQRAAGAKAMPNEGHTPVSSPEPIGEFQKHGLPAATVDAFASTPAVRGSAGVEPRVDGRQPRPTSELPVIRPYENLPSPLSRTPRSTDSATRSADTPAKNSPSASEPGASSETPFELSTEPISSPRGGFGKPRPEQA